MAIMDSLAEFCDATSVALTASASLQTIGSQIDLGVLGRNIGDGQPVYLVVTVDTGIITAGSAGTIQFALTSDSAAAQNVSATVHALSPKYVTDDAPTAALSAGKIVWVQALPSSFFSDTGNTNTYERYLSMGVYVVTTDTTAGKINAFLTLDPVTGGQKRYADASN
jgi:hypothetical protein